MQLVIGDSTTYTIPTVTLDGEPATGGNAPDSFTWSVERYDGVPTPLNGNMIETAVPGTYAAVINWAIGAGRYRISAVLNKGGTHRTIRRRLIEVVD